MSNRIGDAEALPVHGQATHMNAARGLVVAALALACASASVSVCAQVLDDNVTPEFRAWQERNPWYGTDTERTEYARNTMKQLLKERPELQGRALLDEVARRTRQAFSGKAQKR
jgi:hypothetical protein